MSSCMSSALAMASSRSLNSESVLPSTLFESGGECRPVDFEVGGGMDFEVTASVSTAIEEGSVAMASLASVSRV